MGLSVQDGDEASSRRWHVVGTYISEKSKDRDLVAKQSGAAHIINTCKSSMNIMKTLCALQMGLSVQDGDEALIRSKHVAEAEPCISCISKDCGLVGNQTRSCLHHQPHSSSMNTIRSVSALQMGLSVQDGDEASIRSKRIAEADTCISCISKS